MICSVIFRRSFQLPEDVAVAAATVQWTADNGFVLSVNDQGIGRGTDFARLAVFELKGCLKRGANLVSVRAENGGTAPKPAGLIAGIEVRLENGQLIRWGSDRAWTTSAAPDSQGRAARELGSLGRAPWGRPVPAQTGQIIATLYPEYKALACVLQSAGVPPDFQADEPIRYTHRRVGRTEVYFVANREERTVEASCVFRGTGRKPELWYPVTGERRELPVFVVENGCTRIRLRFAPLESCFIVLGEPSARGQATVGNLVKLEHVEESRGPWEVRFDPGRGGPERVESPVLQDWALQSEPGIRFCSGRAVYRKTFERVDSRGAGKQPGRTYLDLGNVKNLARVRLNGCALGVVWCAPWRVEVTDALKPGASELEITVAKLWINRLIGDAGQPPERRFTWTSVNPYRSDSPLSASGLLGPVVLQRATVVENQAPTR